MVKETRIIFGLDDVTKVRIICCDCKGELVRPLSHSSNMLPQECPNCLAEWWDDHCMPRVIDATVGMMKALARLQSVLGKDSTPITVTFEMNGESEG